MGFRYCPTMPNCKVGDITFIDRNGTNKIITIIVRDPSKTVIDMQKFKLRPLNSDSFRTNLPQTKCSRCNRFQCLDKNKCPALGKTCFKCNFKGHFAKVCRTKPDHSTFQTQQNSRSLNYNTRSFFPPRKQSDSNQVYQSYPHRYPLRQIQNLEVQRDEDRVNLMIKNRTKNNQCASTQTDTSKPSCHDIYDPID